MTDYIDYKIGEDWDIDFNEWNDFKVAYDADVLLQNFVLLAVEYVHPHVGEQFTPEKRQRITNRLEKRYKQRDYVDECSIGRFELTEGELSFTVLINSNEYDWQASVRA